MLPSGSRLAFMLIYLPKKLIGVTGGSAALELKTLCVVNDVIIMKMAYILLRH